MTTTTLPRAVVEQALDALTEIYDWTDYKQTPWAGKTCESIAALRAAIDAPQPEPVPVGWLDGPNGTYRPNRLWRLDPMPPQSIAWSIPLFHHMPPGREPTCTCGDPTALNTIHRADGPCYVPVGVHKRREPLTPMDAFEDAIRSVGVVAACEWFGHAPDSEFTKGTFLVLAERARGEA